MNTLTAIVLIVAIISLASVIGSVANARVRARHGLMKDWRGGEVPVPADDDGAKLALQTEVEELRERVKVLERIATDERHPRAIAEEIESLRDR